MVDVSKKTVVLVKNSKKTRKNKAFLCDKCTLFLKMCI